MGTREKLSSPSFSPKLSPRISAKDELKKIIIDGRSTFGKKLKNENIDNWNQINWINK